MSLTQVKGSVLPDEQTFWPGMTMPWPGALDKIPSGWLHIKGQLLNIADQPALFEVLGTIWGGDGSTTFALPPADRFPLMADDKYSVGDTGGDESVSSGSAGNHSHSITVNSGGSHSHSISVNSGGSHSHSVEVGDTSLSSSQMPVHYHAQGAGHRSSDPSRYGAETGLPSIDLYYDNSSGIINNTEAYKTSDNGNSDSHTHPASTNNTGSHSHSASSNNTGSHNHSASSSNTGSHSHTVATMPPYAAMPYIIKT